MQEAQRIEPERLSYVPLGARLLVAGLALFVATLLAFLGAALFFLSGFFRRFFRKFSRGARTQAYTIGAGGVYLNLKGRKPQGVGGFVKALVEVDRKRPPFVPALAVPVYLLFGKSFDIALIVNLLAFVVLLLMVYGLGTRLVSAEVGVLAAFLVAAWHDHQRSWALLFKDHPYC